MLNKKDKIMKKLIGALGVFVATVVLFACSEEDNQVIDSGLVELTNEQLAAIDANASATSDAVLEDIDDIIDLDFDGISNAREIGDDKEAYGDCVTITKEEIDEDTEQLTIDFGDGCTGRRGLTRYGKMIITKTGDRRTEGSIKVVTFDGFATDSVAVEGTRTITVASVTDEAVVMTITMENGKLTFADETSITRDATRTKTIALEEGEVVSSAKFGQANGVNRDGLAYEYTVDEADPIVHTRSCRDAEERIYAPVSGLRTIDIEGESIKTVDYGDGECDNLAIVTVDGVATEITVDPRNRNRKLFRPKRRK